LGPRPVVQLNPCSKIIIISQAPGRRVHETEIPWNDASGRKLREWLNVDEATFYESLFFNNVHGFLLSRKRNFRRPFATARMWPFMASSNPSPRNQNWVKVNPWFTEQAIPELKKRIGEFL